MDKTRIVRIVARLNVGGPAVHILNLMEALDPERFRNHLITGLPGPREGDMSYLAIQKGIEPEVIPELSRDISPLDDALALRKLIRTLRRHRPHIVETHTAKAGAVGRLAAYLTGLAGPPAPAIMHVFHGHVFHSYFGPVKTRAFITIERALARITDRIITISPAQYRDITETYRIARPEKTVVVPLGLKLQPFARARQTSVGQFRRAFGLPSDAPLVGFVGRLAPVKNPNLFIEAARLTLQQTPETYFALVGDGKLRPELERRVEALGLTKHVVFTGWQEDMPATYADLDVMALTSLNEGTPVTVIEALAAGVPVVATAVGGVPDVVTDRRTGLLVPSGDIEAVAQGMLKLLRNPEYARHLAREGQLEVLERFDLTRLAADMESLYRTVLEEKNTYRTFTPRA
jgi:glycosyltransferase involved in cell wall biosynthesis